MKAIILCAGQGTRLRPYTNELPKCMVKVNGLPLIESQLKMLRSRGIKDIVLVGGHCHDKLPGDGVKKIVNTNYKSSNMVESLSTALEHIAGSVIICYGDILYSAEILDDLISAKEDICLAIDSCWKEYWRSRMDAYMNDVETLMIGKSGSIVDIGNTPQSENQIEGQYMGLIRLSEVGSLTFRNFLSDKNQLVNGKTFSDCYMTDMLQSLIDKNIEVWPCFTSLPWIEVDTVDDLHSEVTLQRAKSIMAF